MDTVGEIYVLGAVVKITQRGVSLRSIRRILHNLEQLRYKTILCTPAMKTHNKKKAMNGLWKR